MRCGFAFAAVCVCSSIATLAACAPPQLAGAEIPTSDDGGAPLPDEAMASVEANLDLGEETDGLAVMTRDVGLPAPETALDVHAAAPSSAPVVGCRVGVPAGVCDRCPDRPCRQVRTSLGDEVDEVSWAMFCEEGDLVEEAEIACLCAGGTGPICDVSALETARGLLVLRMFFGGSVPPVGTRYRDSSGLRATVDQALHDWLAAIAGPPAALRCDAPDREAVARDYALDAQRVRVTGSCF